jgi:hypothetical protein
VRKESKEKKSPTPLRRHFPKVLGGLLLTLLLTPATPVAQQAGGVAQTWAVATVKNPLTQQDQCLLQSNTITISDGYGDTKVTLLINDQGLAAVTTSKIDASFQDLTLVVDDNAAIKSDRVIKDETVAFDREAATIVEQFKKGKEATVYLRFWPTWPATQSFPARFSLRGFTKAHETLSNCRPPMQ